MYISASGMTTNGISVRRTDPEVSGRIGEYAVVLGGYQGMIVYLSQEEVETLHARLFEALLNTDSESKNVRVIS